MSIGELGAKGVNKMAMYRWRESGKPGTLEWVNKEELRIDQSYQRDANDSKSTAIARDWSWMSCGALIVVRRPSGLFVVDGQHRLFAAMRRSDIRQLPCIIFESASVVDEASGFLGANTLRKPLTSFDKHKARYVSGDELAIFVESCLAECGLEIRKKCDTAGTIKCLTLCMTLAGQSREAFKRCLEFSAMLSRIDNVAVKERLLDGIFYIHNHVSNGLDDKRLVERLQLIGANGLVQAAGKASAYHARGGAKIWAQGMIQEVNKSLRHKFEIS